MSENNLQQLNSEGETTEPASPKRKKFSKVIDIFLWVIIAVLAVAVLVRLFAFTQITVSGESMTSDYYNTEGAEHYNPELTFHDHEVVNITKLKTPKRGDVVVFYKNDVTSKFLDLFSSKNEDEDGKYAKRFKRVVAIAGDKLWVEKVDGVENTYTVLVETSDGTLLREDYYTHNGEVLDKEAFYITEVAASGLGILAQHIGKSNALVIEKNYIFAMGDNRANSSDSRSFGAVPLSRLFGVVMV